MLVFQQIRIRVDRCLFCELEVSAATTGRTTRTGKARTEHVWRRDRLPYVLVLDVFGANDNLSGHNGKRNRLVVSKQPIPPKDIASSRSLILVSIVI
jgi:hypothetical protein